MKLQRRKMAENSNGIGIMHSDIPFSLLFFKSNLYLA